jgi:hypothetical protein
MVLSSLVGDALDDAGATGSFAAPRRSASLARSGRDAVDLEHDAGPA